MCHSVAIEHRLYVENCFNDWLVSCLPNKKKWNKKLVSVLDHCLSKRSTVKQVKRRSTKNHKDPDDY